MVSTKTKTSATETARTRQRFPAEERIAAMLQGAAEHFAAHGFESPTRDIAKALGVTQALIYKHFKSKDHLIEMTLQSALGDVSVDPDKVDADLPLTEMLARFYKPFVTNSTETRMRLFMRANLDGRSWPARRGSALTNALFVPIISVLRREAKLPGIEELPPMHGERELVMTLHASMVFLGIRRHIYQMPMPDNLDNVVDLQIKIFAGGAKAAMRSIHQGDDEALRVRLMTDLKPQSEAGATLPDRLETSSK